jgi:hypothetical protein
LVRCKARAISSAMDVESLLSVKAALVGAVLLAFLI